MLYILTEQTKVFQKSPIRGVAEQAHRAVRAQMSPYVQQVKDEKEKDFVKKAQALAKRHKTELVHHKKTG